MFVRVRRYGILLASLIALSAGVARVAATPFDDVASDRSGRAENRAASGTKTRRITGQTFTPRRVGAEPAGGARSMQPFQDGRVVYSNTLGDTAIVPDAGRLIADDISTTGANGGGLIRYSFKVIGKADADGPGGPFGVDFALYNQCPFSAPVEGRDALIITGTAGSATFVNDGPHEISLIPAADAPAALPNSFWLGVTFSRDNAGIIGGAPPLEGFSADEYAELNSCNEHLGHFPENPHASFDAVVYVQKDCRPVHLGYKADNILGQAISTSPGWIVDDLHLPEPGCRLLAYEVGVLAGAFSAELRTGCSTLPLPGTRIQMIIDGSIGLERRVIRHELEFPINLPQNVSIAVHSNRGVIIAGEAAEIGSTADFFELQDQSGTCSVLSGPNPYQPAALHVSLICEGASPKGACCDYVLEQCPSGKQEGARCRTDTDCPGGYCASQCREVAKANCPFVSDSYNSQPQWIPGKTCNDPWPSGGPCGRYACCHEEDDIQHCENLTNAQCLAKAPVGLEEKWQKGHHCGGAYTFCPLAACLGAEGSCFEPHSTPGCDDAFCCTDICLFDNFCCSVEWDGVCVEQRIDMCDSPAQNDDCLSAKQLSLPANISGNHSWASLWDRNEAACCQDANVRFCETGWRGGSPCETDSDCQLYNVPGTCSPAPGMIFAGLWYNFIANNSSARVATCSTSSTTGNDSIIQVFAVADNATSDSACNSLVPIACSDDATNCGVGGRLSAVCVDGLEAGNTYYVMVGAKTAEAVTEYRLTIGSTPCTATHDPANESCFAANPVSEGAHRFDLTAAELDCPPDYCDIFAEADVWFDYTASTSGWGRVDACSMDIPGEMRILVYEGCDVCPPLLPEPLACANWPCNSGEGVFDSFLAEAGQCYRIRVTTSDEIRPVGMLLIAPENP